MGCLKHAANCYVLLRWSTYPVRFQLEINWIFFRNEKKNVHVGLWSSKYLAMHDTRGNLYALISMQQVDIIN